MSLPQKRFEFLSRRDECRAVFFLLFNVDISMVYEGYEASLLSFDAGKYAKVMHIWWELHIHVDERERERERGSGGETFACVSNSVQSCDVCTFPILILALMSDTASSCDDSEMMSGVILGFVLTLLG